MRRSMRLGTDPRKAAAARTNFAVAYLRFAHTPSDERIRKSVRDEWIQDFHAPLVIVPEGLCYGYDVIDVYDGRQ